jgi:hypothetical protein
MKIALGSNMVFHSEFDQMEVFKLMCYLFIRSFLPTGISFIVHVMFAAGLEYSDKQLARSVSPGRYRNNIPSIVGLLSGISVQINDGKNVIKKKDYMSLGDD